MESYTIIPDDRGGVSVQVHYESGLAGFHSFKTEAEAKAWLAKQRTEAQSRTEQDEAGNWPI